MCIESSIDTTINYKRQHRHYKLFTFIQRRQLSRRGRSHTGAQDHSHRACARAAALNIDATSAGNVTQHPGIVNHFQAMLLSNIDKTSAGDVNHRRIRHELQRWTYDLPACKSFRSHVAVRIIDSNNRFHRQMIQWVCINCLMAVCVHRTSNRSNQLTINRID